jgi:hypothetical protein
MVGVKVVAADRKGGERMGMEVMAAEVVVVTKVV